MADEEILFKIILVGESGVGKSSILVRFTDNTFTPHFAPTLGVDFNVKTIRNKETGQTVKLQLWDTAGQERFKSITQTFYRGSHGVIVVYDVTDPKSFERCKNWVEDINQNTQDGMIIILVGNKSDLASQRKVTFEQGQQMAEQLKTKFLEVSAKENSGITQVFDILVQDIEATMRNSEVAQKQMDLNQMNGQKKSCC
ncbi:Rab GTPase [Dictyostelium purpureum]|uniref:Rab GTPase n=1 Tax=Dictyostelium purpureum TaxID=5786 RepID=F0ZM91_DICPU|nr:Rab GTPase [Dictyostelium purpureum]EGC34956.1 Rab GTPase [Dictyostelium purpureum]|eukprot:XP_003288537.1 Rab GTPase [Dictyostelium purpureum]